MNIAVPKMSDAPFHVPADVVLDLPVPISVNKTRRVDWRSNKRMLHWTKTAEQMVLGAKCRLESPLKLSKIGRFELIVTLSEVHTRMDLDNGLKWLIDYLRRIELIENDSPINMRRLTVEWGLAPSGCRVTVKPLSDRSERLAAREIA